MTSPKRMWIAAASLLSMACGVNVGEVSSDIAPAANPALHGAKPDVAAPTKPSGLLDPSFGNAGSATLGSEIYDLAIQQDGKIVIALGSALERLMPDGSLDGEFGQQGLAAPLQGQIEHVAITTAGDILIVGRDGDGVRVSKLDSAGALDPNFLTSAMPWPATSVVKHTWLASSGNSIAIGVALDTDNYVLELDGSGQTKTATSLGIANGSLTDMKYDDAGLMLVMNGATSPIAGRLTSAPWTALSFAMFDHGEGSHCSLATAPHGWIAGCRLADGRSGLARLDATGAVDTTFGAAGYVLLDATLDSLVVDALGRPIITFFASKTLTLARLSASGMDLDARFGSHGVATAEFSRSAFSGGLALQSDGRIVVGGTLTDFTGVVVRFLP